MLRGGPVGSPYPGKYVVLAMAVFFAVLLWRCSQSAIKIMKKERMDSDQSTFHKPDAKRNVGAVVWVGLVAAYLFVMAIYAVYKAWPN